MGTSAIDHIRLPGDGTRQDTVEGQTAPAWAEQNGISILVPTRRRPAILGKMLNSLFCLADSPNDLEVVVYIDDDDAETLALDVSPWGVVKIVGPRQSMGRLNAACYAKSRGDIVMLGNDDMVVRTRSWDTRVRNAARCFPDKVYLLYPNDMYKGNRICTFPILSRVTCDSIGDPFPADYRGAFIDVHVMDIFKRLHGFGHQRIAYLDEVIFEHMHYRVGKSRYDSTYQERDRFVDDQTFLALNDARGRAVQKLRTIIDRTESTPQERLILSRPTDGRFPKLVLGILFGSHSPLSWRIRLFFWMWLRFLYRNVKSVFA